MQNKKEVEEVLASLKGVISPEITKKYLDQKVWAKTSPSTMIHASPYATEIPPCPDNSTMIKEYITPEKALEYLSKAGPQRKSRPARVLLYAEEMSKKRWFLTHQPLAFDKEDRLADGSHRLKGIVTSGVPQWMWVCRGIDTKALIAVDQGIARAVADSINIQEGSDTVTKDHIAVFKCLMVNGGEGKKWEVWKKRAKESSTLSVTENVIGMRYYFDAIDFALDCFGYRRVSHITVVPVQAAFAVASYHEDKNKLREMIQILVTGIQPAHQTLATAIRLRNALIFNKHYHVHNRGMNRKILHIVQRAIFHYCRDGDHHIAGNVEYSTYPIPNIGAFLDEVGRARYDM